MVGPRRSRVCRWPSSSYCANIMLRCPIGDEAALSPFVEQAIARGVKLIVGLLVRKA